MEFYGLVLDYQDDDWELLLPGGFSDKYLKSVPEYGPRNYCPSSQTREFWSHDFCTTVFKVEGLHPHVADLYSTYYYSHSQALPKFCLREVSRSLAPCSPYVSMSAVRYFNYSNVKYTYMEAFGLDVVRRYTDYCFSNCVFVRYLELPLCLYEGDYFFSGDEFCYYHCKRYHYLGNLARIGNVISSDYVSCGATHIKELPVIAESGLHITFQGRYFRMNPTTRTFKMVNCTELYVISSVSGPIQHTSLGGMIMSHFMHTELGYYFRHGRLYLHDCPDTLSRSWPSNVSPGMMKRSSKYQFDWISGLCVGDVLYDSNMQETIPKYAMWLLPVEVPECVPLMLEWWKGTFLPFEIVVLICDFVMSFEISGPRGYVLARRKGRIYCYYTYERRIARMDQTLIKREKYLASKLFKKYEVIHTNI